MLPRPQNSLNNCALVSGMPPGDDFAEGIHPVTQFAGAQLVQVANTVLGVGTAAQAHGKQPAFAACHGKQGHIVLVLGGSG
jgi:hypothetical protein